MGGQVFARVCNTKTRVRGAQSLGLSPRKNRLHPDSDGEREKKKWYQLVPADWVEGCRASVVCSGNCLLSSSEVNYSYWAIWCALSV